MDSFGMNVNIHIAKCYNVPVMNQIPSNEVTVEDGKKKFNYKSEGVGVNIFQTLMVILGIFLLLITIIIVCSWRSPLTIIPILIIVGAYLWIYFIVNSNLTEMAHNPETQHLFVLPNQMISAYKVSHPQLSDNIHKPKEISDKTIFTQPQFEEAEIIREKRK